MPNIAYLNHFSQVYNEISVVFQIYSIKIMSNKTNNIIFMCQVKNVECMHQTVYRCVVKVLI